MAELVHDVIWLRHGQAEKAATEGYEADLARQLSALGIQQATARRDMLGSVSFVAVGASPAERTMATAGIVSGWERDRITPLPALIAPDARLGGDDAGIEELFTGIGYASLGSYRAKDAALMDRYGQKTWGTVETFLRYTPSGLVLIVGHAVLSTATCYSGAKGRARGHVRQTLRSVNMSEAAGFRITFTDLVPQEVTLLPSPPPAVAGISIEERRRRFEAGGK